MRTLLVAFFVSMTANAGDTPVEPVPAATEPQVVPVTHEQVRAEAERLAKLDQSAAQQAIGQLVEAAIAKYGTEGVTFLQVGTDSMNAGKDEWRSCAKLTPQHFGMPEGTLSLFIDQNYIPCAKSPGGYVMMAAFVGPDIEDKLVDPVYQSERMTANISMLALLRKQ